MNLFIFPFVPMPLVKAWIHLLSPPWWVHNRDDWVCEPWLDNQSRRKKTLNSNQIYFALKLTLYHILPMVQVLNKFIYFILLLKELWTDRYYFQDNSHTLTLIIIKWGSVIISFHILNLKTDKSSKKICRWDIKIKYWGQMTILLTLNKKRKSKRW